MLKSRVRVIAELKRRILALRAGSLDSLLVRLVELEISA